MKRVAHQRYKLEGGGVYAFYPFDSLDKTGSGVFKIGMTTSFDNRVRGYHTYLPKGFYYKCLLIKPTKLRDDMTLGNYYTMIEREIFKDIKKNGGKPIKMDIRKRDQGETEWIFANEQLVLDAFDRAYDKYKGRKTDLEYSDLGEELTEKMKALSKKQIFKGEIVF